MSRIKIWISILLFSLTSTVRAANYQLKPEELLTLPISNAGPSRIFYEGQKITEVFFYPEEAAKVVLHKSGALFIVPLNGQNAVFVTLMSEEGITQDLKLNFVKKPPEPIKLIPTNSQVSINNSVKTKGAKHGKHSAKNG